MEVSCLENRNIKETMEIAISIGVTGKNNPYLKKNSFMTQKITIFILLIIIKFNFVKIEN